MKEKWNYILYLIWLSYLVLSATSMFGHGFLLSRETMNDVSECVSLESFDCDGRYKGKSILKQPCSANKKIRNILSIPGAPMMCGSSRNRAVVLLVDALSYDFTEYDPEIISPLAYINRLPIIYHTLQKWPERARLYRFMADPPTTTFQRVKALVTGSLPTFIDAGSNFAAMELQEDNFIKQLNKNGGKAVLLGDDTWSRLLPGKWLRSYGMYSFHTWDLDTVDADVDSKIFNELQSNDWDLLVAHYLGVDHAGHRYGPNHSEMTRKLNETNTRLEKVLNVLPPDVLLYVVGDHGMTETGDHGGESKAERTAAIFAYRGAGLGGDGTDLQIGREVQQTDFAPTMSAAFGRPPPAPSLGNLLFSVLPKMNVEESLLHLTNNLKQLSRYLVRYGEESQQVSLDKLAQFINATRKQLDKAAYVETTEQLAKYTADVRLLIDNIRNVFREVWIEFDSISMLRALLLLILIIFLNWLITDGLPMERLPHVFASTFMPCGLISIAVCIGVCSVAFYFKFLEDFEHGIILSTGLVFGVITSVLVIMHWDGISQRWYDGRTQFYERFSRSLFVASAAILTSNSYIIEEGAALSFMALSVLSLMAWKIRTIKALLLWVGSGVVLAASRTYRGCREEQGDCWTAGDSSSTGQASQTALVLALASTAAVVAVTRRHVGWRGYGIILAGLLTCAHWAVGWGALGSPIRSRQLARGAWLVIVTTYLLVWSKEDRGVSLPLTVCSILLYFVNALVLGVASAPSAALGLLSGFLAINIVSLLKTEGSSKYSLSSRCSSSVACMWALLASYHFYGTGHHATLGHIRWAPAFHAGDPNYLTIGPMLTGILVYFELYGMPLMFGAAVPLLVLWERNGTYAVGPRTQLAAVFSLGLKFCLCFTIRVFACALSATIHCRHLMIWGVFTPKFLFEFGSCSAALLGTLIGVTLTAWHLPVQQRSN